MTDVTMTEQLATKFDRALCDLDGVAFSGTRPIKSAVSGIRLARDAGMEFHFVTNNASRDQGQVAEKLTSLHIPTQPADITTSAMAIVRVMLQDFAPGSRVYMVGGDGLRSALLDAGYTLTTSAEMKPVAVVQGLDRSVGWRELSEAAYAIHAGAAYYASNIDTTLPTERGLALGNGSLVAALEAATGQSPITAGKPAPEIFLQAAHGANAPVVIGDRLNTDIAGGRAASIPTIHVLTGISQARDVICAQAAERPDYLLVNLNELTLPYDDANIVPADALHTSVRTALPDMPILAAATCAGDIAVVNEAGVYYQPASAAGGAISQLIEGMRLPVSGYRAVAKALWQAGPDAAERCPDFQVVAP